MRPRAASPQTRRGADVDAVATALRMRIRAGRYAPLHRLVEADLTRELRVSRGVVREALRRLAAEGLVDIAAYRGASVSGLSRAEAKDLFDVLEGLAVVCSRLAAERIDQGTNRRRARAGLEATRRFRKSRHRALLDYVEENGRFHDLLSELCGNARLAALRSQLQVQLFRLMTQGLAVGGPGRVWTEGHERILRSIRAGDAAAAQAQTRAYARRVRALVLALPDSAFVSAAHPRTF